MRQYACRLLENLSKHFEIIIFTASHPFYANEVISILDPHRKWVQHVLYRDSCLQVQGDLLVKDLRVINRPIEDLVIVDNMATSFLNNVKIYYSD